MHATFTYVAYAIMASAMALGYWRWSLVFFLDLHVEIRSGVGVKCATAESHFLLMILGFLDVAVWMKGVELMCCQHCGFHIILTGFYLAILESLPKCPAVNRMLALFHYINYNLFRFWLSECVFCRMKMCQYAVVHGLS